MRRADRAAFDILPRDIQDVRVDALSSAVAVATRCGLDAGRGVVVCETRSMVVDLRSRPDSPFGCVVGGPAVTES